MANLLKPLCVSNFISDSSDSNSDSSDTEWGVDWIKEVLCSPRTSDKERVSKRKPLRKRRRRWKKRPKLPYTSSMFYIDYHNPNVQNLAHIDAKEFRLDYRMPWTEVHKIVRLFVEKKWVRSPLEYTADVHHIMARKICPPEVKILGTLYWLGEGCSFRTIRNLSGRVLSRQSFTNFAKHFCEKVTTFMAPEWVRMPSSLEELREISSAYNHRGLPGACGSTDGVQIAWEGCPYAYRASFTGKEKYPSLGFNVTVAHNMRILHVCSMFAGRFNDKTKILYDEYVTRLRTGYYKGFDMRGNLTRCVCLCARVWMWMCACFLTRTCVCCHPTRCETPYLICDNGYHRWLQLMCPFKTTSKEMLALWSKHLESKRKDAEKTFGVMKKRFRVLKIPLLFR